MKVAVWDTYVAREDGAVMHFDILIQDEYSEEKLAIQLGNDYLNSKPFITGQLTSKECTFCHIERATMEIEVSIKENGYYIIELENCR